MTTSCKTIVKYHSQDTDDHTVELWNSSLTTVTLNPHARPAPTLVPGNR